MYLNRTSIGFFPLLLVDHLNLLNLNKNLRCGFTKAPHLSLEARHGNFTATHRPTGSSQPCCCCGSRSRCCTVELRRVSSLNCKFHSQP